MRKDNSLKMRFKLYKAGKMWLVAGTAFLALSGLGGLSAHADTANGVTTNPAVQTDSATTTASNQTTTEKNKTVAVQETLKQDQNTNATSPQIAETIAANDTEATNNSQSQKVVENDQAKTITDPNAADSKVTDQKDNQVASKTTSETKTDDGKANSVDTKNDQTDVKDDDTQAKSNEKYDTNTDQAKNDKNAKTKILAADEGVKEDGWNADHTQYTKDGQLLTGVHNIDGTYYDFDNDHNLVKNDYVQAQWGDYYMFGEDGRIVTGVKSWQGTYYYFDPSSYLKVTNDYVQSQWGDWYMFGNDGQIVTGVTPWQGTYYYFDPVTYLRVDNKYVQSQWGCWYMFGDQGQIVSGLTPWEGTYYYFDPVTYLRVNNQNVQTPWGTFYFGNQGQIVTDPGTRANLNVQFAPQRKQQAINKMIGWMTDRLGNVTYSMTYRNGPNSYDCSSAVYHALAAGGFLPVGSNGNTETEFNDLERHGWVRVSENSDGYIPAVKGDIFIWGVRGHTLGADGHTGIFYDNNDNIIHCNYLHNGISINNHNEFWELDDEPFVTVYRFNGVL